MVEGLQTCSGLVSSGFKTFELRRCRLQPLSSEAILAGPGGEQALLVRKALPWAACPAQDMKQLKRLTLSTDDPAAAAQAFARGATGCAETAGYDLLAVQPLSERLLQQVLANLLFPPL